ncbi:MAG: hypothetical protein KF753_09320 [Caldilineaceae bacterium]|nr:hypothetical protein [Caldilineaceae bacterium]
MKTVAGIVPENRVDELTKQLIAEGWGENYSLIQRENTSDERIFAAPVPNAADSGPLMAGMVIEPDAAVDPYQTNEGTLHTNVKDELDEFDLSEEEQDFYARQVREGGTFVAVEVDDEDAERAEAIFSQVDAQQLEIVD